MIDEKFHNRFRENLHLLLNKELKKVSAESGMSAACTLMVESINILHQIHPNKKEFKSSCQSVFERVLNFYLKVQNEENIH